MNTKGQPSNISHRSSSIDALKCWAALAVVALHTLSVEQQFDSSIAALCRVAVPLFFVITGWFWDDITSKSHGLKNYWKKIFWLTIIASMIFWLRSLVFCFITHKWDDLYCLFDKGRWLNFLLLNEPINTKARHLWYLFSLLYAIPLIYLFTRRCQRHLLYTLAIVALCINFMIAHHVSAFRSAFLTALPYICLGMFLRQNKANLIHLPKWANALIFIFGVAAVEWEWNDAGLLDHYFGLPILVFSCFIYFANKPKYTHIFAINGQKYSTYIYLFHPLIIGVFKLFRINGQTFHQLSGLSYATLIFPFLIWTTCVFCIWLFYTIKKQLTPFVLKLSNNEK